MLNYKSFVSAIKTLIESSDVPVYAAVKPDLDSIESIVELAETIGLSSSMIVPEKDLHCTVAYSRKAVPIKEIDACVENWLPMEATGDELEIFHQRNGKDCLVLKLASVDLRGLFAELKRYGTSYDFPTYEPHVTLCYDLPEGFKKPEMKPNLSLKFTKYEVKPLEDE